MIAAVALTGCSEVAPQVTSPTTVASTTIDSSTTSTPSVPPGLEAFGLRTVTLQFADTDSVDLLVAVADDPDERAQGLMRVQDLGSLDGMLFDFGEEVDAGFWMFDTPLPLTLVHFTGDGRFVSSVDMDPCPDGDCRSYFADAPFRFGLEIPQGALSEVPMAIGLGD